MDHQNERTCTRLNQVDPNVVGRDDVVLKFGHCDAYSLDSVQRLYFNRLKSKTDVDSHSTRSNAQLFPAIDRDLRVAASIAGAALRGEKNANR